ncbi:NAD(P)-dependent oxidoreductase [Niallia sp. 01092]|uniref:NAD(P)-dependent oxidoreductase n=1 Tax=unclassified Niallia TaxID=2837522 RepID=UPI003FD0AAD1
MEGTTRIAIIGGTGKVGRYLAKKAVENGFKVRMLVRNPDKVAFRDEKIEIISGDAQNLQSIRTLLEGCSIVINTLGQPVKEMPIYSSVTQTIITTMKEYRISRYIGVTGASLTLKSDNKSFINTIGAKAFEILFPKMMKDKRNELDLLINSDIDWTIVRLPFVGEGPETSIIKEHLTDMPGRNISNADIARFLISQINEKKYIRKTPFISN